MNLSSAALTNTRSGAQDLENGKGIDVKPS